MRKILILLTLWLPLLAMGADVTTDKFYINDFTIAPGEEKEIELNLLSTQDYYSFQVNIYLSEGLSFVFNEDEEDYIVPTERIPDGRKNGWPYLGDFVEGGDGSLLVTAYSPNLVEALEAGDGAVFTFRVKADEILTNDGIIYCKFSEMTNGEFNNFNGPDTECHVSVCRTASLADVVAGGINQARYQISNELTFVYVADDGKTVYAKDDNGFAMKDEWPYKPSASQVANNKVFDNPENFDQSNWVVLNLKEEISTSQLGSLIGSKIKVTGILRDRLNPEIDVDDRTVISEGQPYTPNLYTISSFGEGNDYFAMPPKPQEYVKIHWAIYQDGNFYMPKSENGINTQQLHGAVKSVLDMYEGGAFENGNMYELTGIVKALKPRVAAGGNTVYGVNVQDSEVSTYYELHPITSSKTDTDPVTSINRIGNDNEDNTYYNLLGQPVTNPAPGIYIKNGKRIIVR